MGLNLLAVDPDDLTVISTYVQDALTKVGDLRWRPTAMHFDILLNRFRWEKTAGSAGRGTPERGLAALHFSRVLDVKSAGINRQRADGVLELLAMTFEPGQAPGGTIELSFSGGGTVRLSVECVEVQLSDTGASWQAESHPAHPDFESDQ